MNWHTIRAHYATLYAQAQAGGMTQKAIAERGGIAGQNTVSRLLSNDNLGPSVQIFCNAVEGLGKSVAEFFLGIEQGAAMLPPAAATERSLTDRVQSLEQRVEALSLSLSSLLSASSLSAAASSGLASSGPGAQVPPGNREGGASHGSAAVSQGVINYNHIATFELSQFEAKVQSRIDEIGTTLARLDARMAKLSGRHGNSVATKPAVRGAHRR
jgi:transcriptional regulator with XRE-family HTH domain